MARKGSARGALDIVARLPWPCVVVLAALAWGVLHLLAGSEATLVHAVGTVFQFIVPPLLLAGAGTDGGVDLVIRRGEEKHFVRCKHWKAQVNIDLQGNLQFVEPEKLDGEPAFDCFDAGYALPCARHRQSTSKRPAAPIPPPTHMVMTT